MIAAIGFVTWGVQALGPMPEALSTLRSDERVQVSAGRWLVFKPTDQEPTTGLVLYPGGRVDNRSYAPPARELAAQQGTLVVVVPTPLNLAVFAPERATEIIRAFPEIQRWAIGGHSLGGAMAARYVYCSPGSVDGLVVWAAGR